MPIKELHSRLFELAFGIATIGLLFGFRALISIGSVALVLNGIAFAFRKKSWGKLLNNKVAILFAGLFIMTALSGLLSANTTSWMEWMRIKLPLLFLPVAFVVGPPITKKSLIRILYFYFFCCLLSMSMVLIDYYFHFDDINNSYGQGKSMNTPFLYVRYSLFIAFSVLVGIYLMAEHSFKWHSKEGIALLIASSFLFISVHLLAVRSGLLALYLALLLGSFWWMIKSKNYKISLLFLVGLITMPIIAYNSVPSLQHKINYMKWDLQQYFEGNTDNLASDYVRLITWEFGINVWKDSPLVGCGIGDLRDEMNSQYQVNYPMLEKHRWYLPHNQFIFVLAAYGILGLLYYLVVLLYPLIQDRNYQQWIFVLFQVVLFTAFIAEAAAELQIGLSFYLLFVLLFSCHYRSVAELSSNEQLADSSV